MSGTGTTPIDAPEGFGGRWIHPGDLAYDDARRMFNQRADPRPSVIAQCLNASDVAAAITAARANGLTIDVRSSGSTFRLPAAGGLLVDVSHMRSVEVRPDERVARIEGGVRGGDLQTEAGRHGLAGVTGALSSTGVGLILAGGVGHLSPRAGFASDNVLSLEVVTAAGEVVTASPTQHPDLFWGLRGSTGNYGVVTALEVRLHEVPPLVSAGIMSWSTEHIHDAVAGLHGVWDWASDDLAIIAIISSDSMDGRGGLDMFVCHTGPADLARAELDRLRREARPDHVDIAELSFRDVHFAFEEGFPPRRGTINEIAVPELTDDLVDFLTAQTVQSPAGVSRFVEIVPRRGELGRAPEHPSALRDASEPRTWSLGPGCWWDDPEADDRQDEWLATMMDALRGGEHVVGRSHPNAVGVELDLEGVAAMYGERFARLRELKRIWDPENIFRGGHNIPPAG